MGHIPRPHTRDSELGPAKCLGSPDFDAAQIRRTFTPQAVRAGNPVAFG